MVRQRWAATAYGWDPGDGSGDLDCDLASAGADRRIDT
jgi:hypothetical protein